MHISVPIDNAIEIIEQTQVSPLLSYSKVKVLYVGQNRNDTVITKPLAMELGSKIPGSPIVGLFNQETQDFGGHDRAVNVKGGQLEIIDLTKPYGFVPTDAKVWFQKFRDDGIEHEYLCTECYIWTGIYPESQRIIDKGNNQSMELSSKHETGFWTNDDKTGNRIFIYNEALIEKLCVLGEQVEPCFEGAQFRSDFSLKGYPEFEEFKTKMFAMITQLQESINYKGGSQAMENQNLEAEALQKETPAGEEFACGGSGSAAPNKSEDDKKKKKYNLDEVTEYTELKAQYDELQTKFSALEAEKTALDAELTSLREFKASTDHKEKQAMIDSFYMLSDEDKKDCVENIDTYSLNDIEAKLSIICVRNKVNFNLEEDNTEAQEPANAPTGMFNLSQPEDNAPAWIKAVRETAKN